MIAHNFHPISPQEAADILGVSRPLIYYLIRRGGLKAERIAGHVTLTHGEVVELAAKRSQPQS